MYIKTFQYRLKPTLEQSVLLEQQAGGVRFVYNWGTEIIRKRFQAKEALPSAFSLQKELTSLKKQPESQWLYDINSTITNVALKDLSLSVRAFFRELKKKQRVGLPGFRKKGVNDSMRYSTGVRHKNSRFYIPKIGMMEYSNSRPLVGTIKQVVVKKIIDKWFINVTCQMQANACQPNESANWKKKSVNLILGDGFLDKITTIYNKYGSLKKKAKSRSKKKIDIENQGMSSADVKIIRNICKNMEMKFLGAGFYSSRNEKRRLERLLSRRQKALIRRRDSQSKVRYYKQHRLLARTSLYIKRKRYDFLHKLSHNRVKKYDQIIAQEHDLRKLMLGGFIPLTKVLRDKGWDKFTQFLKYKSEEKNREFILT